MKQGLCVVVAALALAGCGAGAGSDGASDKADAKASTSSTPSPTKVPRIEMAADLCTTRTNMGDGGKSITFDTKGKDDSVGDELTAVACVLGAMKAPDYVLNHIDSTRALDGQQSDEWDDYEARWTYHPDSGMNLTIIDRSM